jgi:hypothetical protein
MQRSLRLPWNEEPLVLELKRESGMVTYSPHPQLIGYENWIPPETSTAPLLQVRRAAVIAHSRERYGHPRSEVEREMAQRMGWDKVEQQMQEQAAQAEFSAASSDASRPRRARALGTDWAYGRTGSGAFA